VKPSPNPRSSSPFAAKTTVADQAMGPKAGELAGGDLRNTTCVGAEPDRRLAAKSQMGDNPRVMIAEARVHTRRAAKLIS
jgi:hypothetical protein